MNIGDTVTIAPASRPASGSGTACSNGTARRRITLPALALLLAALLALLALPATSLAKNTSSACSSAAAAQKKTGARACAGRSRKGHAHAKAKGHHVKRHHSIIKKKKSKHPSGTPVAAPPKPAVCEDGSRPVNEGEGSFACANGEEPICQNGAEPAPSKNGTKLLCPTSAHSGPETTDAECEDGSVPNALGTGFACEDGSQPRCEDGSQPKASSDGAALVCLVSGSPSPSSAAEEEDESDES
ncbi:MAG TPA: hypothetical protein VGH21_07350 [Solirubrobacteraceae bacterium]|jgi:hypothetical protein